MSDRCRDLSQAGNLQVENVDLELLQHHKVLVREASSCKEQLEELRVFLHHAQRASPHQADNLAAWLVYGWGLYLSFCQGLSKAPLENIHLYVTHEN